LLVKYKWEAIFFDFDGVILDSVNVKTEAFAAMFRKYGPEVEQAVVEYHLANGGVSRYRKFEYYYHHLLNQDISQEKMEQLDAEFSRLSLEGVLDAPFVGGALDTLEKVNSQGVPAFVVSGAPCMEVRHIVAKRELRRYFIEVHGFPRKKQDIMNDIALRFGYRMKDCLMVGDAAADYEAARMCGTQFLGIVREGAPSPFPSSVRSVTGVYLE
jgi:HAD superfamily hydrolase (TIGR01549 family)